MTDTSKPANSLFGRRGDSKAIEQGLTLAPKFDEHGLIPAIVTDHSTGLVLMFAYMNADALRLTIQTRAAHFYSRSRRKLWKKGEESGNILTVRDLRVDCDQDCIWLAVDVAGHGATCHVGYRSCFYRSVDLGHPTTDGPRGLRLAETERLFDPDQVYRKK